MKKNLFYLLTAIFTLSLCFQGCGKDDSGIDEKKPDQPTTSVISITTQPTSVSVTAGSITGSLSVAASVTPSGTLTYQWYSNTSNSNSGGSAVSGATSASFTIPTTLTTGSYYYFCEVKAGSVASRSSVATITVAAVPVPVITISTQPSSASVTAGSITGSLTVAASVTSSATLTYQWYSNTSNSNSGGSAVSGATSTSFTIPSTLSAGSYYYFCEVSATGATSVRSSVATVTVTAPALPAIEVTINGEISPTKFTIGTKGSVVFNRFPATVAEWKKVQEQIGGTMMGAVTLQIMAGELYMRDTKAGEECIKLNCLNVTATTFISHVKDRKEDRPYQFASFLKGATPANGYSPTKPYTIEYEVRSTGSLISHSSIYEADVYCFFIHTGGRNAPQYITVLKTPKPDEAGERGKYYILNSTSNMTFQCDPKSFTVDYKGLD